MKPGRGSRWLVEIWCGGGCHGSRPLTPSCSFAVRQGRRDGVDGPFDFLLQFRPSGRLRPQVREIRPRGPADREHLIEARLSKGLEDDRLIGMELVAVPLDDGRVEPQLAI